MRGGLISGHTGWQVGILACLLKFLLTRDTLSFPRCYGLKNCVVLWGTHSMGLYLLSGSADVFALPPLPVSWMVVLKP